LFDGQAMRSAQHRAAAQAQSGFARGKRM